MKKQINEIDKIIDSLKAQIVELESIKQNISRKYGRGKESAYGFTVFELTLSTRTHNILLREDIYTISEMRKLTESKILSFRNAGKTTVKEIKKVLSEYNLNLKS